MKLIFENPVACTNCVNCVIVYDIVDDYGYKRFDQEMEFSGTESELRDRIQQLKYMGAYDIEVVGEPGIYESLNEKYFPDIYQCSIDGQKYNIEWDEKSGKYRAPVRLAKKYVYGATAEDVMNEIDRVVAEYFTESKNLKEDRVKHYHYGNSQESRRKEISDRFGKPFIPDDHMIVCKDGKTINIQIGKKYKCTSFYGQRVEVVDIEDVLDDGTAMLDVAWRNKRYAVASTQLYESKLHEQDVEIEVKHEGILEVPEGKNVEDLPISHFVDLAKKKGLSKITKALNNLQVWNKKKNPELSKWAGNMIDKVSNRMENQEKKESIIRNSRINESSRPFDCVTDAVDYYYRNWVNGFVSNEEIRMNLKKKHYSDDFIDSAFETISDRYEDEERYDYEHDYD